MKELPLYYEKRDTETFQFKITLSNQLKERNSVKEGENNGKHKTI